MAKYSYKLENGEYVFYKDGKLLTTPQGIVITTDNEELAKNQEAILMTTSMSST